MEEVHRFKLCIFGNGGVGKTSLTRRYLTKVFDEDIKLTLGTDFSVKYLEIEGKKIALQIWDFAGEERYKVVLPGYATGSNGGIFMYDITRYNTLTGLDSWLSMFKRGADEQIPIIIIGGKSDLQEKKSVSTEEAERYTESRNFKGFLECSAKNGENVEEVFEMITRIMMKHEGLI